MISFQYASRKVSKPLSSSVFNSTATAAFPLVLWTAKGQSRTNLAVPIPILDGRCWINRCKTSVVHPPLSESVSSRPSQPILPPHRVIKITFIVLIENTIDHLRQSQSFGYLEGSCTDCPASTHVGFSITDHCIQWIP